MTPRTHWIVNDYARRLAIVAGLALWGVALLLAALEPTARKGQGGIDWTPLLTVE